MNFGMNGELAKSSSTILSMVTAADQDTVSIAQKWFADMAESAGLNVFFLSMFYFSFTIA